MRPLPLCVGMGLLVVLSNAFVNRHSNALEKLESMVEDELARELGERADNPDVQSKREPAAKVANAKKRGCPSKDAIHKFHNGGKKRRVNLMEQRMLEEDQREQRLMDKISSETSIDGLEETLRQIVSMNARQLAIPESPFCTLEGIDTACDSTDYRRIDGTCNNLNNIQWGMADSLHERVHALQHAYSNKVWSFRTKSVVKESGAFLELPHPRLVSNTIHKAEAANINLTETDRSHMDFAWAQFLVHDIISTPDFEVDETRIDCCTSNNFMCMPLVIGANDGYFDEGYCMDLKRSEIRQSCENDANSGQSFANQINEHTSFIDGSAVYGNDQTSLDELRTKVGGLLFELNDEKPPKDMSGDIPCISDEPGYCFKTGDHRSNVIASLSMLHSVFLAEHNHIANELHVINPSWNDETLFQETRKIIGAIMQHITYNEFLPNILDSTVYAAHGLTPSATQSSSIYDVDVNPTFSSISAMALRYGHSMIPLEMKLFNDAYTVDSDDDVYSVDDMYLRNKYLFYHDYQGDSYLTRFLTSIQSQKSDRFVEATARDLLFKEVDATTGVEDSVDLAAVNIQRGRDWGTLQYYAYYDDSYCGIGNIDFAKNAAGNWSQMAHHSQEVRDLLESIYEHPRDVDAFTGLVSEERLNESILGPTSNCIIAKQFQALKTGDRFFYETSDSDVAFTANQFAEIRKITLGKLLCERLGIAQIQSDVFTIPDDTTNPRQACSALSDIDLTAWNIQA